MRDHYHYHVSYSVTFPSGLLTIDDAALRTKRPFNEKQKMEFKEKEIHRLNEIYKGNYKISIICINEIECDCD